MTPGNVVGRMLQQLSPKLHASGGCRQHFRQSLVKIRVPEWQDVEMVVDNHSGPQATRKVETWQKVVVQFCHTSNSINVREFWALEVRPSSATPGNCRSASSAGRTTSKQFCHLHYKWLPRQRKTNTDHDRYMCYR